MSIVNINWYKLIFSLSHFVTFHLILLSSLCWHIYVINILLIIPLLIQSNSIHNNWYAKIFAKKLHTPLVLPLNFSYSSLFPLNAIYKFVCHHPSSPLVLWACMCPIQGAYELLSLFLAAIFSLLLCHFIQKTCTERDSSKYFHPYFCHATITFLADIFLPKMWPLFCELFLIISICIFVFVEMWRLSFHSTHSSSYFAPKTSLRTTLDNIGWQK